MWPENFAEVIKIKDTKRVRVYYLDELFMNLKS